MNKKKNVDSGRKSARPDYIQKTISQKSSGKRSGKVFFPKTLIKTGGIIIFVLLLGFAGNKFFLSVSKTDSGKVKATAPPSFKTLSAKMPKAPPEEDAARSSSLPCAA